MGLLFLAAARRIITRLFALQEKDLELLEEGRTVLENINKRYRQRDGRFSVYDARQKQIEIAEAWLKLNSNILAVDQFAYRWYQYFERQEEERKIESGKDEWSQSALRGAFMGRTWFMLRNKSIEQIEAELLEHSYRYDGTNEALEQRAEYSFRKVTDLMEYGAIAELYSSEYEAFLAGKNDALRYFFADGNPIDSLNFKGHILFDEKYDTFVLKQGDAIVAWGDCTLRTGGKKEISYYVSHTERNKGIGTYLIEQMVYAISQMEEADEIFIRVNTDNITSLNTFCRAARNKGYEPEIIGTDEVLYRGKKSKEISVRIKIH